MTTARSRPPRSLRDLAPADRRLRALAVGATAATLALIVLGGAVRATDSGLACPDWPACHGQWIPPADLHMWLEHSHRLLAGVVGLAVAVMSLWALVRYRHRRGILWPALGAAALIVVQSALGALVVLLLLRAELVTAHLGAAALILALLITLVVNVTEPLPDRARRRATHRGFATLASAVAALVFLQMLTGAHATGVAAGYVFNAWPIWLAEASVRDISTEREVFHVLHRFLGYGVGAAVIALAVAARRERRRWSAAVGATAAQGRWLTLLPALAVLLVLAQIALGIGNVLTRAATPLAIAHLTGAILLWSVVVLLAQLARRRARPRLPTAAASDVQLAAADVVAPSAALAPATDAEEARA